MPSHSTDLTYLHVRLADATVALPARTVREVVRAVAITPLPGAPAIFEGAVNLRGALVPVVDLRRRLAMGPKAVEPADYLVILAAGARTVAVRVDDVHELVEVDAGSVGSPTALSPALAGLLGLAASTEGILVIHDPDAFISQAEGEAVDDALRRLA